MKSDRQFVNVNLFVRQFTSIQPRQIAANWVNESDVFAPRRLKKKPSSHQFVRNRTPWTLLVSEAIGSEEPRRLLPLAMRNACRAKLSLGIRDFVVAVSITHGSGTPTILVVEDEIVVRTAVVQYLQEHGCTVLEAETGERAMAMCRSDTELDILLTDINLNGPFSGWDLADAFRTARPGIAVVYASGTGRDRSRCVSRSRFFSKPYRMSDILGACQNPPRT
jgi:CheY-like chemotaxis protein